MGCYAINRVCSLGNFNDRILDLGLESYSHFIQFYCFNVNFKYGYEYSCHR